MVICASVAIFSIIVFLIFKLTDRANLKNTLTLIFSVAIILTVVLCVIKPVLHKQFSINAVEYLIKINDDGSMTTTKQTTTTVLEKNK